MFNTHWVMIPMSFFPAGISCGFLGITPEGILFIAVLFALFWIHIGLFFSCKLFLEIDVGEFPSKELLIATGCFIFGYIISLGHEDFHSFVIALLIFGAFFVHDFTFGIVSLFTGNNTWKSILERSIPPIMRPKNKIFFPPQEDYKPNIPISSMPNVDTKEDEWLKNFQEEIINDEKTGVKDNAGKTNKD